MIMKNDNRGLSLIELIVTVLITSILMLAVSLFVSTSRSAYQTVNTSATLQEESMTVERVVSEILMEAQNYQLIKDKEYDDHDYDVLWVRALDNESPSSGYSVYFLVFDKTDNQLRYCKGNETTLVETSPASTPAISKTYTISSVEGYNKIHSECFGTNKKYSLVADHITQFEIKSIVHRPDESGDLITFECKYEYMGKEYNSNIAAVTRNKLRATPADDEDEE